MTVSDRDAFLTTRRLAMVEGILAGGSGGLAVHAALEVAREISDPEAMVAVILPDGGRSYLSKVYNDAWMTQHGFLERATDQTVGDVLYAKQEAGEIPPLVTVGTHQKVRDAVALLHEHRVSQLPVVSAHDAASIVGSIGERGLLKHAVDDPSVLNADIVDVMEPPFPAVSSGDPVREAVELLVGDRQALMVTEQGRATGILTRADLLEALARWTPADFRHASRPRRPRPRPGVRGGHPGHPPELDLRPAARGRVRRGLRLLARRQPDAPRAGERRRRARGRAWLRPSPRAWPPPTR